MGWIPLILLAISSEPATSPPAVPVAFNRDIRPILSDHCYPCHGPDPARRKAGLRLDLESSARVDRDGRRAIVPGDVDASELYRRITAEDADERMPPPKSGKVLTSSQIGMLRRWIAEGARWQRHWAFIPPEHSAIPRVRRPAWVRNPIDAFILARLEREGLSPSSEAERGVLLRRVALDLTGLPPTLAELDAFERDTAPDAYEKVVDRLLASPRFGERMAIRWLNAARYADTNGYQTDAPRVMWRWRDWVIDAYNRNMSFDRFTIEQLAGDLIPGATPEQQIATGFNRNHRGNAEGGIIPEEYAVEYVVDRVDTTATVWLGLTIGCARCHSHKFDPVTQEDYYRFFAFFNNVPENGRAVKYGNSPPFIKAPTRAQQQQLGRLQSRLAELERQVRQREAETASAQVAWESSIRHRPAIDWFPTEHRVALFRGSPDGISPAKEPVDSGRFLVRGTDVPRLSDRFRDGSPRFTPGPVSQAIVLDGRGYVDAGDVAGFGFYDKFTFAAWIRPSGPRGGTIISRMADQPQGEGYSVGLDGGKVQVNLVKRWLDDAIRIESKGTVPIDRWTHVAVTYDGSRVASGIKLYLDGQLAPATVLLDELNQSFETRQPLRIGGGGGLEARFDGAIDEPVVYQRALVPEAVAILATSESIAEIAAFPPGRRTPGQASKLRRCFLATEAPEAIRQLTARANSVRAELDALVERIPTTMVMREMPAPRPTHVLIRGQYDQPGPRVGPGVPGAIAPWPAGRKTDRLGLAVWLTDPANPFTARVAVNRDWQMLFGTGLVKTVDDFGAQGEPPSHPELLDWLAAEFIHSAWDIKAMLRLMVTSATYRQSSRVAPEAYRRDPENRLLQRGPRLRLSAEMIRDQALHVGGRLVERAGGPSVRPYQPPGLWNELADADYIQDHGPDLYRRGLYTFWKRTVPPPSMVAFDAPGRETCIVREVRTDTPLQALNVLNDVTYVEAARAFAERIMNEAGTSPESRVAAAFRAATARRPRPEELAILLEGLADHLARFRRDPRAATELIHAGESPPDPRLDPRELAAYIATAQLILNLDETITKEQPHVDPLADLGQLLTRRDFLGRTGPSLGLGAMALASLLEGDRPAAAASPAPAGAGVQGFPTFTPRARRVIYLFQSGAPSQMDLFDEKPLLSRLQGTELPDSIRMGQRLTGMTSRQDRFPVAASRFRFARHGQSGATLSELLPHTAGVVDRLCFIKSMHTEAINHDPAVTFFQTGAQLAGRPSIGAWVAYGLGSENNDLPAFVVMISQGSGNPNDQPLYDRLWGSGFLPTTYQGVKFRSLGDPVLYLSNPPGISPTARRRMLDDLARLDALNYGEFGDPEILTRITQYELAFRMQTSVPELTDLSNEPESVLAMYGPDVRRPGTYAANCLLARRLAERGVRFIQLFHRGWDQHAHLPAQIAGQCRDTDRASAALVRDLQQRGLLDETLLVWGGEFGRTVYCQGRLTALDYGRDHHPRCFTVWLAGGGIRPGLTHGATDDFGYNIIRDPVHVHDLHATILHCLGIDHTRLTFQYQGRHHRLTDVHGAVIEKVLI